MSPLENKKRSKNKNVKNAFFIKILKNVKNVFYIYGSKDSDLYLLKFELAILLTAAILNLIWVFWIQSLEIYNYIRIKIVFLIR